MWTTTSGSSGSSSGTQHLSHDLPCQGCGHAVHTFLPCSDTCACSVNALPGAASVQVLVAA